MDEETRAQIADLKRRIRVLEARLNEQPLEFPPIDLGMIPGTGANHPFEPFEYCERN